MFKNQNDYFYRRCKERPALQLPYIIRYGLFSRVSG